MIFSNVSEAPPDPIFGMASCFKADERPEKISLMVGIFKDDHLQSMLMPTVKSVKSAILVHDLLADYLPIDGLAEFTEQIGSLIFGKKLWEQNQSKIYSAQTVGGTSALRLGADFLAQEIGKKMYIPKPTWGNHRNIFEHAGFVVENVPYYSQEIHQFDANAYLHAIELIPPKSILLMHACCHNPTGSDPTIEVWKQISDICKKKSIIPFFDFAYQGFGEGIEEDASAVRLFLQEGHEFLVAYSCSKNFSLYCQRVGALYAVSSSGTSKERIGSQVKRLIRSVYSNPPAHGAKIVAHILKNSEQKTSWENELNLMRKRIAEMRSLLITKLSSTSKNKDFSFLEQHKGMFSYLDLSKNQVDRLIDRHALYTLDSGRINIAGITHKNIDAIVESIVAVCQS